MIFVNAMTSLESVDVYVNGDEEEQRVVEGLEYGTVSEEFQGTAPGTVVVVKQNVNLGFDQYLFNTLIPTAAGNTYVIVISDFLISPVQLDTSATAGDGARTVGVHAASQAPAVDLYVTPAGEAFSIGDVVPLIAGLQYGYTTAGGPAATGSYDVRLTQSDSDALVLEQAGIAIDANLSYAFVLIGKPGSTEQPLTLISVSVATQS